MSKVIAFMPDTSCRAFSTADVAQDHGAAMVFESSPEMARVLASRDMDRVRASLLGMPVPDSPSKEEAAKLLWYLLYKNLRDEIPERKTHDVSRDVFGNRHFDYESVELIEVLYREGRSRHLNHWMLEKLFDELTLLAKRIVITLATQDSRVMRPESAVAILEKYREELNTKFDMSANMRYHFCGLVNKGFMRKLSVTDFTRKERYRGMVVL